MVALLLVAFIINTQQSDESDLLKFVHNQIQICLDTSEKNLTLQTDFYKPLPRGMWCNRSNSNFQTASHSDWGIMGYNDVIVCITVINLTNAFFFIGLDRSRLTNLIVDYEHNHFLGHPTCTWWSKLCSLIGRLCLQVSGRRNLHGIELCSIWCKFLLQVCCTVFLIIYQRCYRYSEDFR